MWAASGRHGHLLGRWWSVLLGGIDSRSGPGNPQGADLPAVRPGRESGAATSGTTPGRVHCKSMQGVVKIYDPNTGAGVVVLDGDRSEVYLRAGSLAGSVFRLLRQGQRIVFEIEKAEGRRFAHSVRLGSDGR